MIDCVFKNTSMSNTVISLANVHKTYGKKSSAYEALRGVSLTLQAGESVAIQGKSGSGKSTLMHLLAGLDTPTSGSVLVEGKAMETMKEGTLANFRNQKFGFVFQQFFLQPNLTVLENVTLPLRIRGVSPKKRHEIGNRLLQEVGLAEKAKNRATDLSGGQKQRVAIARALVNDPGIIFADEPTGNLDSETSEQVIALLFNLHRRRNVTLVIVTHDKELAERCDRILHIQDGKILD